MATEAEREKYRRYWLERFSLDEIRNLAAGIWEADLRRGVADN